jgi:hypothetical protein
VSTASAALGAMGPAYKTIASITVGGRGMTL